MVRSIVTWPWRFVRGLSWLGRGLLALGVVLVAVGVFTGAQFLTATRLTDVTPADGALLNTKVVVVQTSLPRFEPGEADLVVAIDGAQVPASAVEEQSGTLRVTLPFEDGTHTVKVELRSGNIFARHLTRSWSFAVDTTAPTVTVVSPTPPEEVGRKDSTLRFGFSEPVDATLTIDGTELALQTTELTAQAALDLAEGRHAFRLAVTDTAGNPAVKEWSAWADYTAPEVSVTGLPKGSTKKNSADLTITAKDSVPESMVVEATLDGKPVEVTEKTAAKTPAAATTTETTSSNQASPAATTATTKATTSTTKKPTTTTTKPTATTTMPRRAPPRTPATTTTKKITTTTKPATTTTKPATTTTAPPQTTTTAGASAGGPVYALYHGTPLRAVRVATSTATTATTTTSAADAASAATAPAPSTPGSRTFLVSTGTLAEGVHRVTLSVRDGGGHSVEQDQTFVVDSTETLGKHELIEGAKGADVKQLQSILIAKKLMTGKATGVFDEATADVVEKFRTSRQLEAIPLVDRDVLSRLLGAIKIDISERKLYLYSEGKVVKTYGVAIGMPQYPTPTGNFSIISKVYHPTWTPPPSPWAAGAEPVPPGPDNPLGTRWIGISSPSVGIHGTPQDWSIGTAASHGCIRMHIPEVEALFEKVYVGTPVSIVR